MNEPLNNKNKINKDEPASIDYIKLINKNKKTENRNNYKYNPIGGKKYQNHPIENKKIINK